MTEVPLLMQVSRAPRVAWIHRPLSPVPSGSLSQRCLWTLIADWPAIYDASSDVNGNHRTQSNVAECLNVRRRVSEISDVLSACSVCCVECMCVLTR